MIQIYLNESQLMKKHGYIVMTSKPELKQRNESKCEGFAYCFLQLQWCSVPGVARMRIMTFKLYPICVKQYEKNVWSRATIRH